MIVIIIIIVFLRYIHSYISFLLLKQGSKSLKGVGKFWWEILNPGEHKSVSKFRLRPYIQMDMGQVNKSTGVPVHALRYCHE